MSRAISAELFKLRTTRTSWAVALGSVGLVLIISLIAALTADFSDSTDPPGPNLMQIGGLVQIFALVLGILSVATEFRHGTITPSLLAVPDRGRLVVAKLVTALLAGALLGLVAEGLCAAIVLPLLSSRDIATEASTSRSDRADRRQHRRVRAVRSDRSGPGRGDPQPGRRDHRRARLDLPDRAAAHADPRLRGLHRALVPDRGRERAGRDGDQLRCARAAPRRAAAAGLHRAVRRGRAVSSCAAATSALSALPSARARPTARPCPPRSSRRRSARSRRAASARGPRARRRCPRGPRRARRRPAEREPARPAA